MSFTLKKNYNFMPFCFKGITGYIPDTEENAKLMEAEVEGECKDEKSEKDMDTESQGKPKDIANKIQNKVPEQRTTQENILL
jgi:hypothetical protein